MLESRQSLFCACSTSSACDTIHDTVLSTGSGDDANSAYDMTRLGIFLRIRIRFCTTFIVCIVIVVGYDTEEVSHYSLSGGKA